MPHRTDHVIHQLKKLLQAPLSGGGKRWHVALLCIICFVAGAWIF